MEKGNNTQHNALSEAGDSIPLLLIFKMKKQTKIIKDKKQTRTTIPKQFVDEAGIETGDKMEWELKKKKLKGELKKNE